MALPTDTFTGTDLDVFRPEIWAPKVNEYAKANLVMADFFTDMSDVLSTGADTIHIPNLTELTASVKSNATAVTLVSPTETKVDLTVDTWYECSFVIEKREAKQVASSYMLQERYAQAAAYAIAKQIDTAIGTLFAGFSQVIGSSTYTIVDSTIRTAINYLDTANAPKGDRAFFFTPAAFWTHLQAIDKFSLAINTAGADPILKRPDAYLYGEPVYMTTNLYAASGSRNHAYAHKDAIVWATFGIDVDTNYIPEYLGYLTTADAVYGVVENRDLYGVCIKTPSAST